MPPGLSNILGWMVPVPPMHAAGQLELTARTPAGLAGLLRLLDFDGSFSSSAESQRGGRGGAGEGEGKGGVGWLLLRTSFNDVLCVWPDKREAKAGQHIRPSFQYVRAIPYGDMLPAIRLTQQPRQ